MMASFRKKTIDAFGMYVRSFWSESEWEREKTDQRRRSISIMTESWQLCSENACAHEEEKYVLSAIFLLASDDDDDYIIFIMIERRIRWISQCYSSRFLSVSLVQMKYIDHCANILHRFFSMPSKQMTTIRFKRRKETRTSESSKATISCRLQHVPGKDDECN